MARAASRPLSPPTPHRLAVRAASPAATLIEIKAKLGRPKDRLVVAELLRLLAARGG